MIKYIIPFAISFLLTVFLTAILLVLAKRIKWQARKDKRHIHKKDVYRIGGVAMVLAFNATILLNKDLVIVSELYGLMIGSIIIMAFGFWDDIKEIFWKTQIFFQVAVAVLIFVMGVRIYYVTNPLTGGILKMEGGTWVVLATILVIFWIVFVMNAMNWLDGVDGLAGGITAISAFTILLLSLRPEVNQPPIAIICAILFGTVLAFLAFNFYPSKVLAGTSGAMFMGLSLSVLAIFSGTKIATTLLVLVIPVIDFFWVFLSRLKNKKSIFRPDNNHLHYRLMDLGWSQRKIALVYYAITVVIAFIALNTRAIGKTATLITVVVIMSAFSLVINKKIYQMARNKI